MGKKSKILYFSILIVNILCFILDLLPFNFHFFNISFGCSLLLIGISLIVRGFAYKIDSSLFFGIALAIFGALNLFEYFGNVYFGLLNKYLWPYYLFGLAVASLFTGIYFKDKLQLKLFALFLGFGVILCLFVYGLIKLWLLITLLIIWFVGYFTINTIVYKKRGK